MSIDVFTGADVTIDILQSRVYDKQLFEADCFYSALPAATPFYISFVTPANPNTCVFRYAAAGPEVRVRLYEAAGATTSGTAITPINFWRQAGAAAAAAAVLNNVTSGTLGTLLNDHLITNAGGSSIQDQLAAQPPTILLASTRYLLSVLNTSAAAANAVAVLRWSEISR